MCYCLISKNHKFTYLIRIRKKPLENPLDTFCDIESSKKPQGPQKIPRFEGKLIDWQLFIKKG